MLYLESPYTWIITWMLPIQTKAAECFKDKRQFMNLWPYLTFKKRSKVQSNMIWGISVHHSLYVVFYITVLTLWPSDQHISLKGKVRGQKCYTVLCCNNQFLRLFFKHINLSFNLEHLGAGQMIRWPHSAALQRFIGSACKHETFEWLIQSFPSFHRLDDTSQRRRKHDLIDAELKETRKTAHFSCITF